MLSFVGENCGLRATQWVAPTCGGLVAVVWAGVGGRDCLHGWRAHRWFNESGSPTFDSELWIEGDQWVAPTGGEFGRWRVGGGGKGWRGLARR